MAIDANEVVLQLTQSLMCSSSGAVLQFPISLSSDGQVFTILRTVYRLRSTSEELDVNSHVLDFNASHPFWQPRVPSKWKAHANNLYLYWLYFDDQGQYLCCVEQFLHDDLIVRAFRYNRTQIIDTAPQFISQVSIPLGRGFVEHYPGRNRREFELAYHPFVGAIVVAGSNKSAFLWNFESSRPLQLLNGGSGGKLEMVSFTSDGKSVVWKRSGDLPFAINVESMLSPKPSSVELLDRPLKSSISSTFVPGAAKTKINANPAQTSNEEENGDDESRLLELRPPVSSHVATFGAGAGAIRPYGNGALIHEPGQSEKEVLLMVSDRRVVISRVQSSEDNGDIGITNENDHEKQLELRNSQNLILTRIPNWGFEAATPTVVFPREEGDPVRIVLDKDSTTANRVNPSQSSSSASGNLLSHQNSPVIIERQIRSIQRQNQYNAQKALLLSSPEQPENNDLAQLVEDAEANSVETAERDENTLATDDKLVIMGSLPAEVDEGTIVSMPHTSNPKTSTTQSSHEDASFTKEKGFRKKLFGTLFSVLKRKSKA